MMAGSMDRSIGRGIGRDAAGGFEGVTAQECLEWWLRRGLAVSLNDGEVTGIRYEGVEADG